jgi:hypothetical protein
VLDIADTSSAQQLPQALDTLITCPEPVHFEPTLMLTLRLRFVA